MTPVPQPPQRTVVVGANSAWNIVNFRRPIVQALRGAGWRVVALAPPDGHEGELAKIGAEFEPIEMDAGGTSVVKDGKLLLNYWTVFRRLRPQAFLGFTIKPNIYGSLAASALGIRIINNISGLGTAFMRPGLLNRLVTGLYKIALGNSATVFFQNRHDRDLFTGKSLVRDAQAVVIPGSGIDLQHFSPSPQGNPAGAGFRFLFVGRLLRDKGVVEYADAARILRPAWPGAEFAILGPAYSNNPTAVPIELIERWRQENVVTLLGETRDVRPFIEAADCIVLPSYREGLPRSLLEASAMARPMVAADVPGCSDVVEDGVNGFLCEAKSATSLADALGRMLELAPDARAEMGRRAREKVERQFDQAVVVKAYLEALA